jgi:hypothetical protein
MILKDAQLSSTKAPHNGFDCCTAEKALDGKLDSFAHTDDDTWNKAGGWW